ncbi:hypothetical protein JBE04_27190 [Streptomyces sp. PRKS01-29]|nr:hypothetical protein [Streptomyces sabulosicollis]
MVQRGAVSAHLASHSARLRRRRNTGDAAVGGGTGGDAGFLRAVVQSSGDTGLTVRAENLTNADDATVTATPLARLTNRAILQTLPRTVNTGMGAALILTTLTTLTALADDTLADFALALLIGLAVGTCSSVFTAASLTIELHPHRKASRPSRFTRRGSASGRKVVSTSDGAPR